MYVEDNRTGTAFEVSDSGEVEAQIRGLVQAAAESVRLWIEATQLSEHKPALGDAPPARKVSDELQAAGVDLASGLRIVADELQDLATALIESHRGYAVTDSEAADLFGGKR